MSPVPSYRSKQAEAVVNIGVMVNMEVVNTGLVVNMEIELQILQHDPFQVASFSSRSSSHFNLPAPSQSQFTTASVLPPIMTVPLQDYTLFESYQLTKDLKLKNRIVLSPLTRARCDPVTHEAGPLQVEYYSQRAGAGLIITEAVAVSEQGFGWYGAPCMYTESHRDSWKPVVEAVHAKGSKIFLQIWHIGRQGHPSFSGDVVGPSAIAPVSGHTRDVNAEKVPYELCRELRTDEIPGIIDDFCTAARLAKEAGFDGIDIHAANGYLPDTFLQSSTNKRTDKYGGSIENRARFLLELVEALQKEWPADRIGLRLSPNGFYGDTGSTDNHDMCCFVAEKLSKYGLAYMATLDGFGFGFNDKGPLTKPIDVKKNFKGTVIAANSYDRDTAEGVLRSGAADLVSFGRPYISNPDLAERYYNDWPLNEPAGYDTWYGTRMPGPHGYIDFPTYKHDSNFERRQYTLAAPIDPLSSFT